MEKSREDSIGGGFSLIQERVEKVIAKLKNSEITSQEYTTCVSLQVEDAYNLYKKRKPAEKDIELDDKPKKAVKEDYNRLVNLLVLNSYDAYKKEFLSRENYVSFMGVLLDIHIRETVEEKRLLPNEEIKRLREGAMLTLERDVDEFSPHTEKTVTLSSFFTRILARVNYDAYKSGKMSRNDYGTFMCLQLENYILKLIKEKHYYSKASVEDLKQGGFIAIARTLDDYDPYESNPSTFFTCYILEDLRKEVKNSTGNSEYYNTKATRLNKKVRKYGYSGLDDERLTPDLISTLTDVSLATVVETLREISVNTDADFATLENVSSVGASNHRPEHGNPLDILIKQEEQSDTIAAFESLSPLQQFLFIRTELADERKKTRVKKSEVEKMNEKSSRKELLEILRTPEAREAFKGELPSYIDQCYIQTQINHARRKLQNNRTMLKHAPESWIKDNRVDGYEQASEAEISAAILSGEWDDLD